MPTRRNLAARVCAGGRAHAIMRIVKSPTNSAIHQTVGNRTDAKTAGMDLRSAGCSRINCRFTAGRRERARKSARALPNVVTIEAPVYPWAVKEAHIEGIVHIKVTTDGRAVTTAEIQGRTATTRHCRGVQRYRSSPEILPSRSDYLHRNVRIQNSQTHGSLPRPLRR